MAIPRVTIEQVSLSKEAKEQIVAAQALGVEVNEVHFDQKANCYWDEDERAMQVWWGPGVWPLHGEIKDHKS